MADVKYCPVCKSSNIEIIQDKEIEKYKCHECGFTGALFPEKNDENIELNDEKDDENKDYEEFEGEE